MTWQEVWLKPMEQNQQRLVDLLEIYHARQTQAHIVSQLKRLRSANQELPIGELPRKREVIGYYEALLLTVAELQHSLGDTELTSSS